MDDIYIYIFIYGGFLKWGYPKWMVSFMENLIYKLMMKRGTHILRNLHMNLWGLLRIWDPQNHSFLYKNVVIHDLDELGVKPPYS